MTFYGLPKRAITLTGFQWSASALIKLIRTNKSPPKGKCEKFPYCQLQATVCIGM